MLLALPAASISILFRLGYTHHMSEGTQRRLAAIVSADVVGYSRLMGADEAYTLAALRAHRAELIDPLVSEHGGRIVKTMGDGLLLEFPSVVAAVQCAIRFQEGMAARNATVPEDRRITFRVGINLGDIAIDRRRYPWRWRECGRPTSGRKRAGRLSAFGHCL